MGEPARTLFPPLTPNVWACAFADFAPGTTSAAFPWTAAELASVADHRLAGVALRLHRQGRLALPTWVVGALRDAAVVLAERSVAIVRSAELAADALRSSGIDYVVTKGPGMFPRASGVVERPFADVDVLVAARDFRRARDLLAGLGFAEAPASRPPWSRFDTTCREAVNLRLEPHGSIDLHHHVPPWLWGRQLRTADLLEAAVAGPPSVTRLAVLPPEHNLLVVALHIVSDHGRPGATVMAWRDLLALAAVADAGAVAELARRYRLAGWLGWLIDQYPPELRPDGLRQALAAPASRSASVPHAWRLRHLLPPSISSRHLVGQALRLPAPRAAVYLTGMVVPSPAFLRARFPDRRGRYLSWWREGVSGITQAGVEPPALEVWPPRRAAGGELTC